MYGYVYLTTNTINNKIYIGQHKGTKLDNSYIGSGKLLKQAIDKYGRDKFTCEILEKISETKKRQYVTGEVIHPNKGKKLGDRTTPEYKEELRKRMTGENNPQYGKRRELSPNWGKLRPHKEIDKKRMTLISRELGRLKTEATIQAVKDKLDWVKNNLDEANKILATAFDEKGRIFKCRCVLLEKDGESHFIPFKGLFTHLLNGWEEIYSSTIGGSRVYMIFRKYFDLQIPSVKVPEEFKKWAKTLSEEELNNVLSERT